MEAQRGREQNVGLPSLDLLDHARMEIHQLGKLLLSVIHPVPFTTDALAEAHEAFAVLG